MFITILGWCALAFIILIIVNFLLSDQGGMSGLNFIILMIFFHWKISIPVLLVISFLAGLFLT